MKTTLLILLVGLVAGANARHYVNAESLLEAMKRYLGPEELERREVRGIPVDHKVAGLDLLAEKRDTEMCANCIAVPLSEAEAVANSCSSKTTEIAPVFEKPAGEEFKGLDCTCLKEYVCCPNPCPTMDEKTKLCNQIQGCKKLDDFQGFYRFLEVGDCCGCNRRHIAKCPPPKTLVCDACQTLKEHHHLNELGCWESGCVTAPEPPKPTVFCDGRCQKEIQVPAECGFKKPECEDIPVDNCHEPEPVTNVCREDPVKVLKDEYTDGTGSETCSQCYTWSHPLIPTTFTPITCDTNCQTKEEKEDGCGNKVEECSKNDFYEPCHPVEPPFDNCTKPYVKTDIEEWNFIDESCSQCVEWKAELKAIVKIPKECDDKCFDTKRDDDDCGGWTEFCDAKTCERAECRPAQPTQENCFEPAKKNEETNVYCANGAGCDQCWDWEDPVRTPCPTILPTCHGQSGLPGVCFEEIIEEGKCCDAKICTGVEEQCTQKFDSPDAGTACPEGSVILVGTSTCGTTRHLCYPCVKQEVICDECHDKKLDEANMVGCKEDRCVKKTCPSLVIPQSCDGPPEVSTTACGCPIITCKSNVDV